MLSSSHVCFYLSLYNWYTEWAKSDGKQTGNGFIFSFCCLEIWFVSLFYCSMTFPANSIILLSFEFKNKSHFGHYDPLPSIYLSPVVGKGESGGAIVFLFFHLLSLFLVSSFPVCWWRRGGGNPFTGLVLLWSVLWCPLGVVFTCTLFLCGMFVGYLEVLQGFLHCIVPWHRWLTYCDTDPPPLALAFSTPPYIFSLLESLAVCYSICLAQRKFTMVIMLSLLPFFLAQPLWAALPSLLPSHSGNKHQPLYSHASLHSKQHISDSLKSSYPPTTSTLVHWGKACEFPQLTMHIFRRYLLLGSHTQSLGLILLEYPSLAWGQNWPLIRRKGDIPTRLKTHNIPPYQRSVFLCRLGGVRVKRLVWPSWANPRVHMASVCSFCPLCNLEVCTAYCSQLWGLNPNSENTGKDIVQFLIHYNNPMRN